MVVSAWLASGSHLGNTNDLRLRDVLGDHALLHLVECINIIALFSKPLHLRIQEFNCASCVPDVFGSITMFTSRTLVTPMARVAYRPQTLRFTARAAPFRVQVAANSTISEAITKDHRELERYYKEIVNNPDDIDHQTRYGNQFTWELARHSVAEELLVYPAFEKYMGPLGHDHAERDRKHHHEVMQLVLPLRRGESN